MIYMLFRRRCDEIPMGFFTITTNYMVTPFTVGERVVGM